MNNVKTCQDMEMAKRDAKRALTVTLSQRSRSVSCVSNPL
jgi:hypothetical protein